MTLANFSKYAPKLSQQIDEMRALLKNYLAPALKSPHQIELVANQIAQLDALARVYGTPRFERLELRRQSIRLSGTGVTRKISKLCIQFVDAVEYLLGNCTGAHARIGGSVRDMRNELTYRAKIIQWVITDRCADFPE
jgi:hypothetical protein